jgi:hypothetical protein
MKAVLREMKSFVTKSQKSLPDSELFKLNPGTTINRRWVVVFNSYFHDII